MPSQLSAVKFTVSDSHLDRIAGPQRFLEFRLSPGKQWELLGNLASTDEIAVTTQIQVSSFEAGKTRLFIHFLYQ